MTVKLACREHKLEPPILIARPPLPPDKINLIAFNYAFQENVSQPNSIRFNQEKAITQREWVIKA